MRPFHFEEAIMRQRWVWRSSFSTWLLSLNCECIYSKTSFFVFGRYVGLWAEQTVWWRTELLGEEMDGFLFFFGITHRLCVQGKEWVAAFSGPQPVLHTCLYSRIDLGALSHGWKRNERNTNLLFQLKRYLCATCVWRIWVKSVSCCVCVCACISQCVCVGCRYTQCISFFFFFFYCDTPWFNCSRFPC